MASYIQTGGYSAASLRSQDHSNGEQNGVNGNGNGRYTLDMTSSRSGMKPYHRGRRQTRTAARGFRPGCGFGVFILIVLCIVSVTIIGGDFLFSFLRSPRGVHSFPRSSEFLERQDQPNLFNLWNSRSNRIGSEDWEDDSGNRTSKKQRSLHFGKSFVQKEELRDRDSRYWDKDDRRRDRFFDYDDEKEDDYLDYDNKDNTNHIDTSKSDHGKSTDLNGGSNNKVVGSSKETESVLKRSAFSNAGGGLYNERGRKELRIYEEKLEADLKDELDSNRLSIHSGSSAETNSTESTKSDNSFLEENEDDSYDDAGTGDNDSIQEDFHHVDTRKTYENDKSITANDPNELRTRDSPVKRITQNTGSRKTRHHHAAYPCPISFLESTSGLHEPPPDPRFHNFTLNYVKDEDSEGVNSWEPRFAGHQTWNQRNQSFIAKDQTIHCGFVGSSKVTGFDLSDEDTKYLATCRIAVSSCIFSNSDNIRSPRNRKLTGPFKKDVCFVMFVDQQTLDVMQKEGQQLDDKGYLGSWKVVLVKNLPYTDARRVGKIPKFLAHRLYPSARYSIWLDSKLRLQNDPVLILEYFLWRGHYEYAISNHYDRHCVWEEVQQNKKLNKYNHTAIDEQFAFYQADGLTRFNASDPKKLLPSNVPEGSFIIREHTPMSNLFSCLWFNEVDRFTSRDQLSFAYTFMKLTRMNPGKRFHFNMFKDCERKSIAKLFRHRKNASSSIDTSVHEKSIQML